MKYKDPKIFSNLSNYQKFSDIIYNTDIKKMKLSSELYDSRECRKFVRQFLNQNDKYYSDTFLKLLKKHKIIFKMNSNDYFSANRKMLIINYRMNIDDSLAIIHEFLHYMHYEMKKDGENETFKEVNSKTYELLLSDYLFKELNISSAKSQVNNNYFTNIEMAREAKLELEIYKLLLNNKNINKKELRKELRDYLSDPFQKYAVNDVDNYSVYLIGSLFSAYIHENILNNNLTFSDYKQIRDAIINENFKDLSKMLDLDFIVDNLGFDISQDSIKKLEKTYKKEVNYYE